MKRTLDDGDWDRRLEHWIASGCRAHSVIHREHALDKMKKALLGGANPNAFSPTGEVPIVFGLVRWKDNDETEAETPLNLQAVQLMVQHGCVLQVISPKYGQSILHHAAWNGTVRMVKFLLDQGCFAGCVDSNGKTPVFDAIQRNSKRSADMVKLLLPVTPVQCLLPCPLSLLIVACKTKYIEIVETVLLYRKCELDVKDAKGHTPLMYAAKNRAIGHLLIPLLLQSGADVSVKTHDGVDAFIFAYASGSVQTMKLLEFTAVPTSLSKCRPLTDCFDPMAHVLAGKPYGAKFATPGKLLEDVKTAQNDLPPHYFWAICRSMFPSCNAKVKEEVVYAVLKSNNPRLVRLLEPELRFQSVGHMVLQQNNLEMLRNAMAWKFNPFMRNEKLERVIDCAPNPAIRAALLEYARFRPTRHHAQWYGPYFVARAFAFLLVLERWKNTGVRSLGRDVTLYILQCIANLETV